MGTRFSITPPADFVLARDVCSYGYFLLAPNRWDPRAMTLTRPLALADGPATLSVSQPGAAPAVDGPGAGAGAPLRVAADRALSRPERREAIRLLTRMLRLDDDLSEFHRADPRWARSGRGRLFRSPTFFEDVVKTVTSCNVTWPGTVRMNARLCEVISPAFPAPGQIAARRPATLRARCGVGYRDRRLVELARMFSRGETDAAWFENPARGDDEIRAALIALPGIGPYGAANLLQLLGRYSCLPIDTEAVRHGRTALGMEGEAREIERRLAAHYERFGGQRFRSYWFEMFVGYERRKGPAWTWDAEVVGASFTASTAAGGAAADGGPRVRRRSVSARPRCGGALR